MGQQRRDRSEELIEEIYSLTREIEKDYPELYQYVEDLPVYQPGPAGKHLDPDELDQYLQTLQDMVRIHRESDERGHRSPGNA